MNNNKIESNNVIDNSNVHKRDNTPATRIRYYVLLFAEILIVFIKIFIEIISATVKLFLKDELKDVSKDTVLITGTGHGIGKELAKQYAEMGCKVVCVDINENNNDGTVKEINEMKKGKAFGYKCDVTNRDDIAALSQKILTEVGEVTVLVNNAGIMPCHPLVQTTPEEIRRIFDINVFAHFWLLEKFLPRMIEQNRGHIISLSSMAGVIGLSNLVPYCASKFAVRGMLESLHEEIREDPRKLNIHFTVVYPYMVDTGLCKKPKIKFPSLMPLLEPKFVAKEIILAHRKNTAEASVPGYMLSLNNITRNFPLSCGIILKDFLESGVESDL